MNDNTYYQQMNNINDQIKSMSNVLQETDGVSLLSRQQEMENIVQSESERLQQKKHSVELATTSQNRLITLNENYNKRFAEYIKMIISITIALAIIAITVFFKLPSTIIIIISIIVISIALIFNITIYASISSRDNIYFDELSYDTVNPDTPQNDFNIGQTNNKGSQNLFNNCYGSDCCSIGTAWDSTSQKCIPLVTDLQNALR
jgi:hypothetical protein